MKKILNIGILLLSLTSCSNNFLSNVSSTCSCVKNPINEESQINFKLITNIDYKEITSVVGSYSWQSLQSRIKEEDFEKFYLFLNKEYKKVDNDYLNEKFNYDIYEPYVWRISIVNHFMDSIAIRSMYDENKNYYFIIQGAKESYLSIPITPEEMKEFPSY